MSDHKLQLQAVEAQDVARLRSLVEIDGPLLNIRDVVLTSRPLMRCQAQDALGTLRYLITDYGLDVNATYLAGPAPDKPENLLIRAIDEDNIAAVEVLLEEGADTQCPGLAFTALDYYLMRVNDASLSFDCFSSGPMRMIRLLIHHGDGPDISKDQQRNLRSCSQKHPTPLHFRDAGKKEFFNPGLRSGAPRPPSQNGPDLQDDWVDVQPETWIDESIVPFRYNELPSARTVRLLELQPSGSDADPIRCKVLQRPLLEVPKYEVLSLDFHRSGETAFILLDGKTLEIPIEAWRGLQALRLQHKSRILWTEAISINPESFSEQVEHLNNLEYICEKSSRLVAYLGEAEDESNLVFDHLRRYELPGRPSLPNYPANTTRQAFLRLCARPWFFRNRSVLEIAGHRQKPIFVICGSDRAELKKLAYSSSFLPPERSYHPELGVHLPSHLHHLVQLSLRHVIPCRDHTLAVRACRRMPRSPSESDNIMSALELIISLYCGIESKITDRGLHESISAVVAAKNNGGHAVVAQVSFLFRGAFRDLMEQTDDFSVIHWFWGGCKTTLGLFRAMEPYFPETFPYLCPTVPFPRATGSWTHRSNCLTKISSYRHASHVLNCNEEARRDAPEIMYIGGGSSPLDTIACISDELLHCDMLPGSEYWKRVLRAWEILLVRELGDKQKAHDDTQSGNYSSLTEAFADTLRARERVSGYRAPIGPSIEGCVGSGWYARFGGGVLAVEESSFFAEVERLDGWIRTIKGKKTRQTREKGNDDGNDDDDDPALWSAFAVEMETACYGRQFFISASGSMGLAPRGARPGDELVFCPGAIYPLLMRKNDEEGTTHRLIGDCFLHDFDMDKFDETWNEGDKVYKVVCERGGGGLSI